MTGRVWVRDHDELPQSCYRLKQVPLKEDSNRGVMARENQSDSSLLGLHEKHQLIFAGMNRNANSIHVGGGLAGTGERLSDWQVVEGIQIRCA